MSKSAPIRVLHVIDSLQLGGAQLIVENLVRFTDPAMFHCKVASLHGAGPYADRLRGHGVEALSFAARKSDPLMPWRFLRTVWDWRPQVVHLHLVVSSFLGEWLSHLMPPGTRLVCNIQNMYGDHKDSPYQNWLEWFTYRRSARILACSQAVERSVKQHRAERHSPMVVIHNGVDDALLTGHSKEDRQRLRAELGVGENELVLLSASRLAIQKNLGHGLEVVAELLRRRPGLTYWIAGTGPEEDALRSKVAELGIGDSVRFLGYRGDVPSLLSAADIFLMPSLYEGLPLVLIEAMGKGAACVVTPFAAVAEMIKDGENGVVIPYEDPALGAGRIDSLLEDHALMAKMGHEALKVAREVFAASVMARKVQEEYEKVLQK